MNRPSKGTFLPVKNRLYQKLKALKPSKVFVVASVLGFISVIVSFYFSQGKTINMFFFRNSSDTGMDFFHSIEYLKGNMPYKRFNTLYPPLANLMFKLIYHMMPANVIEKWRLSYSGSLRMVGTTADLRTYQAPMVMFILFIILSVLMLSAIICTFIEKKEYIWKQGLLFSSICSYGMLYAFERGNIIIISWIFTVIFLLLFDNKKRLLSEIGLISLALAAGLKIYPAIYGLLLLQKKHCNKALRALIYGLLAILLPFLCFEEGLSGLSIWVQQLKSHVSTPQVDYSIFPMLELLRDDIQMVYGISISKWLIKSIAIVFLCIPVILSFMEKSLWKKIYYLTISLLLFSSKNYYELTYILIPLLFHIRDADMFSKKSVVCLCCMILLSINIPLFNSRAIFTIDIFGIMIVMCVLEAIFYLIAKFKGKDTGKPGLRQ